MSSHRGGRGGRGGFSRDGGGGRSSSDKKFSSDRSSGGGGGRGGRGGFGGGGRGGRGGATGGRSSHHSTPRKIYSKAGTHPSVQAKTTSSSNKKSFSNKKDGRDSARPSTAPSQPSKPLMTRAERSRASFLAKPKREQKIMKEWKERKRGRGTQDEEEEGETKPLPARPFKQQRTESTERPTTASRPATANRGRIQDRASESDEDDDAPAPVAPFKKAGGTGKRPKNFLDKSSALSLLQTMKTPKSAEGLKTPTTTPSSTTRSPTIIQGVFGRRQPQMITPSPTIRSSTSTSPTINQTPKSSPPTPSSTKKSSPKLSSSAQTSPAPISSVARHRKRIREDEDDSLVVVDGPESESDEVKVMVDDLFSSSVPVDKKVVESDESEFDLVDPDESMTVTTKSVTAQESLHHPSTTTTNSPIKQPATFAPSASTLGSVGDESRELNDEFPELEDDFLED